MKSPEERVLDDISSKSAAELVEEYAPLVRIVAKKIAYRLPPNVELDDLISAGVIGLLDAIEKFDAEKCPSFRRYAEIRIRGAILDELRSLDWVSRSVRKKNSELETVKRDLRQDLGRAPSEEEIADRLGVQVGDYHDLLYKLKPVLMVSVEDLGSRGDDNKKNFEDFLKDPRAVDPFAQAYFGNMKQALKEIIEELPEKQRIVISLYYFEQMNLKEIGKMLGVTESRVSQLNSAACKTLQMKLKRKLS